MLYTIPESKIFSLMPAIEKLFHATLSEFCMLAFAVCMLAGVEFATGLC